MTIAAVIFDLDDTLYPQASWLAGAWHAVAERAEEQHVDRDRLVTALAAIAQEGSDRGRIIDRALEAIGRTDVAVAPLVDAFRHHAPNHLEPFPGAREALADLSRRLPLGLVSDGDPEGQEGKLRALGVAGLFRSIVLSDRLGRHHRKPHPLPFVLALSELGVTGAEAVYVGDRPAKDIAGATAVGMRSIRVHTGEYGATPDEVEPWASAPDVVAAIELVWSSLGARTAPTHLSPPNTRA